VFDRLRCRRADEGVFLYAFDLLQLDGQDLRHACKLGLEGVVSKRLGSPYRSGWFKDWLKFKNTAAPAVKREAEEEWGKERWR